jgi:hypothetical protein
VGGGADISCAAGIQGRAGIFRISHDPEGVHAAVERAFYNRTTIDNVTSVTPQDLEIAKGADGLVISAAYSVRVPLFANVSVCLDFRPTSEK